MSDAQFIAELFMVVIDKEITGFEHSLIDQAYANYEDPENPDLAFNKEAFSASLSVARERLKIIYDTDPSISEFLSSVSNLYTLWAILVLDGDKIDNFDEFTSLFLKFSAEVSAVSHQKKLERSAPASQGAALPEAANDTPPASPEALQYFDANQSATTEHPQRAKRLAALRRALKIED